MHILYSCQIPHVCKNPWILVQATSKKDDCSSVQCVHSPEFRKIRLSKLSLPDEPAEVGVALVVSVLTDTHNSFTTLTTRNYKLLGAYWIARKRWLKKKQTQSEKLSPDMCTWSKPKEKWHFGISRTLLQLSRTSTCISSSSSSSCISSSSPPVHLMRFITSLWNFAKALGPAQSKSVSHV